ncbi:hypothetical protein HALLA_16530 [Halostagnicola larsenii XH-48]|uniref:Uncharacterized protein n=1 Tax=Halostagnicola larsenii XH-48 TaxID=797299 RepID=W0JN75_9EURY|nr:hypothetical protein [Halostagnicola larsenii]AHG00166.1 hypothetical protein HALLA_16530 [Halostagnicola larsenii XH-48]
MAIDPESLERRLRERFGGPMAESRVVVRQAVDLDDSGRYTATVDIELTNDLVIAELSDAPDGTPADRWNWWIGSLEIAFGDYERFGISRYQR